MARKSALPAVAAPAAALAALLLSAAPAAALHPLHFNPQMPPTRFVVPSSSSWSYQGDGGGGGLIGAPAGPCPTNVAVQVEAFSRPAAWMSPARVYGRATVTNRNPWGMIVQDSTIELYSPEGQPVAYTQCKGLGPGARIPYSPRPSQYAARASCGFEVPTPDADPTARYASARAVVTLPSGSRCYSDVTVVSPGPGGYIAPQPLLISTGGGGLGSAGPMVRAAAPVKSVVGGNRKMLSTTVDLPAADGDKQQGNSNNDRVRKMLRNPYSRPKRNEWIEWAPRY